MNCITPISLSLSSFCLKLEPESETKGFKGIVGGLFELFPSLSSVDVSQHALSLEKPREY